MRPSSLLSPTDRLGRVPQREHKDFPAYLRDAVLGAVDGTVTTFAVVAGAIMAGGNRRMVDADRPRAGNGEPLRGRPLDGREQLPRHAR